ncbi:MAG TPA: serine protease [Pyrinomonadaceae bacterium]|nr:serine protease [Pyrinomonadaceae bacterium]
MPERSHILGVFLAAALLCANAIDASAHAHPTLSDLVEHVKRAVVIVHAFDERGRPVAQGSGFFIAQNRVVTNLHVVGRAARVELLTFDGRPCHVAGALAYDAGRDLALLETAAPPTDVTTLPVEASEPRAGEEIFVVSNPRDSGTWHVTHGTTLAPRNFQDLGRMVRITASISVGSSGGPVVNLQGRVVGVATMNLKASEESFFAVPGAPVRHLRPGPLMPFPLRASH